MNYNEMDEEFNPQEYHRFMDALLDTDNECFTEFMKLSKDFKLLCLEVVASVIKNEQINLKWLADYISTAEFLGAFLPRVFDDESMKSYIENMTEAIMEYCEWADECDIADLLFGRIHEVDRYMPKYMEMIEETYEEALFEKYADELEE